MMATALRCEMEAGVRTAFLPISVQGKDVLIEHAPNIWCASNAQNRSQAAGIAFRKSKNTNDRIEGEVLTYGDATYGIDEGDGWLRCKIKAKDEPPKHDVPTKTASSSSTSSSKGAVAASV